MAANALALQQFADIDEAEIEARIRAARRNSASAW